MISNFLRRLCYSKLYKNTVDLNYRAWNINYIYTVAEKSSIFDLLYFSDLCFTSWIFTGVHVQVVI